MKEEFDRLRASIESVKIHFEMAAPPMHGLTTTVHFFESGEYKQLTVDNMRATYFDRVVVSSIRGSLAATKSRFVPFTSARDFGRNLLYAYRRIVLPASRPVSPSVPLLDMRGFEPNNIAHLMVDVIPYYYLAKEAIGSEITAVFRSIREPYLSWLKLFNVSLICENRRMIGETIKICGTRGLAVHDLFSTFDCNGIQFVPKTYSKMNFPSDLRYERIFLARRAPRNLQNQSEVEELTKRYGYSTLFMEDYTPREQIGLAAQAKYVIALHGAAMSLLLFNDKIESIIEIFPPNVYDRMFPACLGSRVARYDQIVSDFDRRVAHSGWDAIQFFKNRSFSAPVHLLQGLLSEIHEQ
jgi:hypothetical protein